MAVCRNGPPMSQKQAAATRAVEAVARRQARFARETRNTRAIAAANAHMRGDGVRLARAVPSAAALPQGPPPPLALVRPRPALWIAAVVLLPLALIGILQLSPARRPVWLSLMLTDPQDIAPSAPPLQPLAARAPVPSVAGAAPPDLVHPSRARDTIVAMEAPAGLPASAAYGPPAPVELAAPADAAARIVDAPGAGVASPPPLAALHEDAGEPPASVRSDPPAILPAEAAPGPQEALAYPVGRCDVENGDASSLLPPRPATQSQEFGQALAAAALRQTADFVVYTDKYRKLAFPMGDVPSLFGVCTDVVIRAYRALGVDLQARIHAARIGSSDPSIAHRRTFTLRRYFASRGASLPISDFAEDYLPGDIVTYYRPQNSGSRDHIAIVAAAVSPSGRPMIVHNRGWGPQLEDALFVDKITGHYRYRGQEDPMQAVASLRKKLRPQLARLSLLKGIGATRRSKAMKTVFKIRAESRRSPVKQ